MFTHNLGADVKNYTAAVAFQTKRQLTELTQRRAYHTLAIERAVQQQETATART